MADEEKAAAKPETEAKSDAKPSAKADAKAGTKAAKDGKPAKKGNPMMLILMIVGGLIVLTGASLAVIFMVIVPKLKTAQATDKKPVVVEAGMGPVFEVKDLVINSSDPDELHYFKVGVAFEVRDAKMLEELKLRDPAIRDLMITELSRHTVQELNSGAGREALRHDLLEKLKTRVGKDAFKSLFFTEYVAQ